MSDFTFNEFLTGILKFNDENVMHIGFNSDTEDIIITNWNASANTHKTLQTNLNGDGGGGLSVDDFVTGAEPSGDVTLTAANLRFGALAYTSDLDSVNMPNVSTIPQYAFYHSNVSDIYAPAFVGNTSGTSAFAYSKLNKITDSEFPNLTDLNKYGTTAVFEGCTSVAKIFLSKLKATGSNTFKGCTSLITAVLPAFNGTLGASSFENCTALNNVDILKPSIGAVAFKGCTNLNLMVIRSDTLISLSAATVFQNSPFAPTGTGGDLYVNSDLVTSYEQATNWSALNITVHAIEGSYYATHYADGTEITP